MEYKGEECKKAELKFEMILKLFREQNLVFDSTIDLIIQKLYQILRFDEVVDNEISADNKVLETDVVGMLLFELEVQEKHMQKLRIILKHLNKII